MPSLHLGGSVRIERRALLFERLRTIRRTRIAILQGPQDVLPIPYFVRVSQGHRKKTYDRKPQFFGVHVYFFVLSEIISFSMSFPSSACTEFFPAFSSRHTGI